MTLQNYFDSISRELQERSDRVRTGFATHNLSAGENREDIVAKFLADYLPKQFGVSTGLILATSGEFSNQADLVVVDQQNNAPLFPEESNKLWLVEAVYALVEVKTRLSPSDLSDAVAKCRRFKRLPRVFDQHPSTPRIDDSLFVLWGWEAPDPATLKANVSGALAGVPIDEQPDFILVPGSVLFAGGNYRQLSRLGQPGSLRRTLMERQAGGADSLNAQIAADPMEAFRLDQNSLLGWLIWFVSWLKAAGVRSAPLQAYLDKSKVMGTAI